MNTILPVLNLAAAGTTQSSWDQAIGIAVLLAAAILSYFLMRAIILPLIRSWVSKSRNQLDDMLLDAQLLHRGCLLAPFIMVYLLVSGTSYLPDTLTGYLPAVFRNDDLANTWWAPCSESSRRSSCCSSPWPSAPRSTLSTPPTRPLRSPASVR